MLKRLMVATAATVALAHLAGCGTTPGGGGGGPTPVPTATPLESPSPEATAMPTNEWGGRPDSGWGAPDSGTGAPDSGTVIVP